MDKKKFMISMGIRVKTQRERIGISQEELARKLGYKNKASISRIESGKNEIPQSRMQDFADALDTDITYLMGWSKLNISESEFASLMYTMISENLDSIMPTEEEFRMIALYRKASERDKSLIDNILKEYESTEAEKT